MDLGEVQNLCVLERVTGGEVVSFPLKLSSLEEKISCYLCTEGKVMHCTDWHCDEDEKGS